MKISRNNNSFFLYTVENSTWTL